MNTADALRDFTDQQLLDELARRLRAREADPATVPFPGRTRRPLSKPERIVLVALAEDPADTYTVDALTAVVTDLYRHRRVARRLSDKTVGRALRGLLALGLADRPHGPHGGAAVTEAGLALLATLRKRPAAAA